MLEGVRWQDLGAALALVLVFEGLMPLLSPRTARRVAATMALVEERALRAIGAVMVALGLGALYFVRG